jgi:hypothetical protein
VSYGKIACMAGSAQDPILLREDLSTEYYALLDVVSKYDGWLLGVKGWSVTLSLAGLGLGFQQRHFALFALAAVTGLAFWYLDGLMKGYQYRYYVRMRETEYTAYLINRVSFDSREYGDSEISAPRIDMMWGFRGYLLEDGKPLVDEHGKPLPHPPWRRVPRSPEKPKPNDGESKPEAERAESNADWRADEPWRRNAQEIYSDLRGRFWWPNVALPHAVAVLLGTALFIAAALHAPGFEQLHL